MAEKPAVTVSDLDQNKKLTFSRGRYNILDCGIRTGKTYWAMNNLVNYTRDKKKNRVLFLTDTTALKTYLTSEYENCAEVDEMWFRRSNWGENPDDKIGIMCYQGLGALLMKNDINILKDIDVICWDECDSIFDFAVDAFTVARRTDFARKQVSNSEVLAIIQKYSSNYRYMPLIMLGAWERIIQEVRILCIGLSASPERAYAYYDTLTHASYTGKVEANYKIGEDLYFTSLFDHIKTLSKDHAYWCYSPSIETNKRIVELVNRLGFCGIEFHSEKNDKKPMDEAQRNAAHMVETTGFIPQPYNFVVVTKAFMRGITIRDPRFDHVIIDSFRQEDRIQAPRQVHSYIRHLKTPMGPLEERYLNKWMTLDECRALAKELQIYEYDQNNRGRVMSWNKLKTVLPTMGYTIESSRRIEKPGSRTYVKIYRITGEWHDAELTDHGFEELVEARMAQLNGDLPQLEE